MKRNTDISRVFLVYVLMYFGLGIISGCNTLKRMNSGDEKKNPENFYVGGKINSYRINKVTGEYTNGEVNEQFIGYIFGKHGKGFQASIRSTIGIEVVRIWWSNDSIVVMNRIEKDYIVIRAEKYLGECSEMLKEDAIHSMLLGKLGNFITDQIYVSKNDMEGSGKNTYVVNGCFLEIHTDSTKMIDRFIGWKNGRNNAKIKYIGGQKIYGVWYPEGMEISNGDNEEEKLLLIFKNIEINTDGNVEMNIPQGYKRKQAV